MDSDKRKKQGRLEVICGPMFSGKSEELIRRLRRAMIAKQRVIAFKHSIDVRPTVEYIASHDGKKTKAHAIDTIEHMNKFLVPDIEVIGIDEAQFFSYRLVAIVHHLVREGKHIIVAGLELDFRGLPFGCMPTLMALADSVTKLHAICTVCGAEAHFTQRVVNGKPARYDDPTIVIGAQEWYQARCRRCYRIDKIPTFT